MKLIDYVFVVVVAAVAGALAGVYLIATRSPEPSVSPAPSTPAVTTSPAVATSFEGCYTVTHVTSAHPHAEALDEFCVEKQSGVWMLYPGAGMSDWISGPYPLTQLGMSSNYRFNATVDPHPIASDGHPANHVNFQINFSNGNKAKIIGIGASPLLHGGTAHALR